MSQQNRCEGNNERSDTKEQGEEAEDYTSMGMHNILRALLTILRDGSLIVCIGAIVGGIAFWRSSSCGD